MPENVTIIGSGPAGWASAIYAARANLNPLVYEGAWTEQNPVLPLGQLALTTEVENYPGFPFGDLRGFLASAIGPDRQAMLPPTPDHEKWAVQGPELMELMRQQAANFGTRIVSDNIVQVDFKSHPFKLTAGDGKLIESHAVIVATGAVANYLGLESEDRYKNRGVSACAVCDGALPRFRNQPVVVVGGGDSAVEEATYLAKFASRVYLVHRRDQLRASKIMVERAHNTKNIELTWNTVVDEVLGNDKQGVTGVRLKNILNNETREQPASGMFAAIGHTPNTGFLRGQLELTEKKYIRWVQAARTYTSVPGVFAAGDVADDYYRQAITAAGSGCMAALDAERWLASQGLH